MAGVAEKAVYHATKTGDLPAFQAELQNDPYLLDGASFAYSRNLLHIATIWEQVAIVEDLLGRNPKLAEDFDSNNSSPLHIAAAKGNLQIVSKLLAVAPEMCWSLDGQGMNPIHIAAKNGHVEILEHLLGVNPSPAMERVNRGQTVLHLCVKHGQLVALQVLVEKLGDLVNAKDDDGETLLHWAVRCNQLQMVQYLVENTNIFVTANNSMEYTPRGTLEQMPRNDTRVEIKKVLIKSEAFSVYTLNPNSKARDAIIVALALIATVAFQAIVTPPGGVWQDDSSTHKAGEAVMLTNHPQIFTYFIYFNAVTFIASLIAILMIIPTDASIIRITSMIAMYGFLIAFSCVGMSYGASLMMILHVPVRQTIAPVYFAYAGIFVSILCVWIRLSPVWKLIKEMCRHSR